MAKSNIPVITGPILNMPTRASDRYDRPYANAGMMHKAGVKVAIRTNDSENVRNLPFNAGFAGVKHKGRWTFINKNGYFITKNPTYQFLNVLPFSSSKLAPVQVNFEGVEKKWGYITTNGQRAIPYLFDKAGVFKGGMANVLIGNKSFMINEKGDCLGNCPDNY